MLGLGVFREAALGLVALDVVIVGAAIDAEVKPLARRRTLPRRNQDALADREARRVLAQLGDDARRFAAADVRHRNLRRQSAAHPDVEMIERARLYLDQDFVVVK